MTDQHEDELVATQTTGYKPGEKKSLQEYQTLDAGDESLNKWKQSLGVNALSAGPHDDPRKVVIMHIALEVEGRDDVTVDLSTTNTADEDKKTKFVIKEGVEYRMKIKFKIQHDVVSGLKYLQVVKRKGVTVDRTEEMLGSYGPTAEFYEKKFLPEEAPSGFLARGTYNAKSKFVDDDNHTHAEFGWTFDIKKDW